MADVLVGVVRSLDINRLNEDYHIATALDLKDAKDNTLRQYASNSWGSAVLAWTYISFSSTAARGTSDLGGFVRLIMSWIYHRFPTWDPAHLDVPYFYWHKV
ncbi:hypothetical protein PIB30_098673 [Stylosanthes scabra]|uniref:Aminotransferase-like plant mobile domain-containing protein n=1 Tax=Stylosanthes scabra TaxID=79078 RepID=A0ABU6YYG6_9FABA|nr:hypothetical protein [Stylosanthes scabra]